MTRTALLSLIMLAILPSFSFAQRQEVGLLIGAEQSPAPQALPGTSLSIGVSKTFQATYAHRLADAQLAALYLEVPFVANPSRDVSSSNPAVPRNFANIFITPGIQFKFLPGSPLAPWFSIGGGYARFDESSSLINGQPSTATRGRNTGAFQVGAGVDVRTPIHFIALRGEVREFYTGSHPNLILNSGQGGQNHVVYSGGFVLRF